MADGTNLIVSHISIESENIGEVLQRLIALGVPFEKNVSVPSGFGKGCVAARCCMCRGRSSEPAC